MQNAVYCFGSVSVSVRHIGKKSFQEFLRVLNSYGQCRFQTLYVQVKELVG